jgi:hypothetical protein
MQRINEVVDGEATLEALSPSERERLVALTAVLRAATEPLRTAPVPDLSASVMARIAELRPEPAADGLLTTAHRLLGAILKPRQFTLQLRPAFVIAGLMLVIAVGLLKNSQSGDLLPDGVVAAGSEPEVTRVYVEFRLDAVGATRVTLAGSFNHWRPEHELVESAPGVWSILIPLEPGIHDYSFVIDGERWVADPNALQVDDGFGGMNSRIALPVPSPQS